MIMVTNAEYLLLGVVKQDDDRIITYAPDEQRHKCVEILGFHSSF
jgi:hypothetical protein